MNMNSVATDDHIFKDHLQSDLISIDYSELVAALSNVGLSSQYLEAPDSR